MGGFLRLCCLIALGYLAGFGAASAQVFTNASFTGKYFVRHVQFSTSAANAITDARSIIGVMNFDGSGQYSLTGEQTVGTSAAASYSVSGTYSMSPGSTMTLTNPQTTTANINARFGQEAIVGASTEISGNTFDIFVAIPAPASGENNASAGGRWSATDFELTSASTAMVRASFVSLTLDGAGNIPALSLTGHAVTINSGAPVNQAVAGGTYGVVGDGTGTINFPLPAGIAAANAVLASGTRTLFVSKSGNVMLAGTPGAHDLFIAIRNSTQPTTPASGRFWNAGLRVDSSGPSYSYTGSSTIIAADNSFISSKRLRETGAGPLNVTEAALYTAATDGTGSLGAAKSAIEPTAAAGAANIVTASDGNLLDPTGYEISFGITIPTVSGTGVFVNPQGIVNAASNAPAGDAISPGEFIAIYGSGLAAATVQAQALPFPTSLGGVTVSINGTLAPIFFISAGQIDCIVPYEVTGQTATIIVTNNNATSNSVTTILAPTSPGVFSQDSTGTSDGSITHANGTLVNAASPALKGETVVMYISGLGNLTTKVSDGYGATAVDNAVTPLTVYVSGIPVPASDVAYQGLTVDAGLYQINFTVPGSLTVSGELPLAILTPDAFTDVVNIAVQ
jgi:uncharacterized protein (TIGR03437 family)